MAGIPNIVPITDLRQDATSIVRRAAQTREPVYITQRGRATAVMLSLQDYERTQQELEILRLLARGEQEIAAGQGFGLEAVMTEAAALLKGEPS
jgi:prevent-host-death family protein